jgi:mannose-6-phosphate isomerase-like protein (cupin superfamily)
MKSFPAIVITAVVAFAAGIGTAATLPMSPQILDLGALTANDLPPPAGANAAIRSKVLVAQDSATVGVQIGTTPKHYHADANEIQYVVDGTGTEWLGDKQVALKPGIMLIIPKGTIHGGLTETTGHMKIIAIKTPPQAADDTHPVP